MTQHFDLCVIGAGSGGLVTAAGAAQLGARVALIEAHRMGGDCLNTGCVPSKTLISAANQGLDFAAAMDRVQHVIAEIAPMDSAERMAALGVHIISGFARFNGPKSVIVEGQGIIEAKRFVIATGGKPAIPDIPGLDNMSFFTNETLFENRIRPDHLLILGGGPIGVEMAQAFTRLGVRVTILSRGRLLPREDSEAGSLVERALMREGARIFCNVSVGRAIQTDLGVRLETDKGFVNGSHLLIAVGRLPNIADLNCAAAGIAIEKGRLVLDSGLRTTNRRVYALGDAAGGAQFTHLAAHQAGLILRKTLFRLPITFNPLVIPRVTFTDPEIAAIGLDEDQARKVHGEIEILRASFAHNDRAVCEGRRDGFAKLIVTKKGRLLGAVLAGYRTGELLPLLQQLIATKAGVRALSSLTFAYPTHAEILKRAASQYYVTRLFTGRVRSIVKFFLRLM